MNLETKFKIGSFLRRIFKPFLCDHHEIWRVIGDRYKEGQWWTHQCNDCGIPIKEVGITWDDKNIQDKNLLENLTKLKSND